MKTFDAQEGAYENHNSKKEDIMSNSFISCVMAVAFAGVGFVADPAALFERGELTVSTAAACGVNEINCIPKPEPAVNFHGTEKKTDLIPVLVCHPWWNELWGDPAQGTRWWGPTKYYQRTQWSADLAAVHQRCKWFYMVPGEAITTEVSCLDGELVSTGPVTRAMAKTQVNFRRLR